MKYIITFLLCFMLSIAFGQSNNSIETTLSFKQDTFKLSEPIYLFVTLKNTSRKTLFIPKDISIASNLLPNGISDSYTGGVIDFSIKPVSTFSTIYIENIVAMTPAKFIKLRPNSKIEFKIDIGKHLTYFNEHIENEKLEIHTNKFYELSVTYANNWKKKGFENQTYLGQTESNKINFYIME